MTLEEIAKESGLSTAQLLDLARKVEGFTASLSPQEQAAYRQLAGKMARHSPEKRCEIQKFLGDQAAQPGASVMGVCYVDSCTPGE